VEKRERNNPIAGGLEEGKEGDRKSREKLERGERK